MAHLRYQQDPETRYIKKQHLLVNGGIKTDGFIKTSMGAVDRFIHTQSCIKNILIYMMTLRNFVVRCTQSGDLFRETGVVHQISYSFNYFFLLVLFTQFIADIK